jgi:hypothetical protein
MGTPKRLVLKIMLLGPAAALLMALALTARAPERVVAIADVHGAYEELTAILQRTALIDANRQWTGGAATLVQTGDVLDRGAQTRACLDMLMALERQAEKAGGKMIPLDGNHEVMNLMCDVRYVTPAIYRTFAVDQSEKTRTQAYGDYLRFSTAHRKHSHQAVPPEDEAGRQKWMEDHPPGYFEYRDAMGPDGKYGRWIRSHHVIVRVGNGIFVHGGLSPALKFGSVGELDDRVRAEIANFDLMWRTLSAQRVIWRYMTLAEAVEFVAEELKWIQSSGQVDDPSAVRMMQNLIGYGNWLAYSSDGPLWYRGLAEEPEEKLMDGVVAMLSRLKAQYIVEGHTVLSKSDIIPRFDSRVFLIDTGMNKEEYQGRPSALEILSGKFTAFFTDGVVKVLAAPGSAK